MGGAEATRDGWGQSSLNYDSAAYDLAEIFLEPETHTQQDVVELATCIQNAIEDWFFRWDYQRKEGASKCGYRTK